MANATLTIAINGNVNGKPIAFTLTQTVDNIDPVVQRQGTTGSAESIVTHSIPSVTTSSPTADQDHDILMVANQGARSTIFAELNDSTQFLRVFLEPGAFYIVQKADAGGCYNTSTTATTSTCISSDYITVGKANEFSGQALFHVFGCYNYAS